MRHKCFISFKTEDSDYKDQIQNELNIDMIDKSLNDPIDSNNEDYIMRVIRRDYLQDSTVTIVLIGDHSAENSLFENQHYIKRELQASLYGEHNGVLGIVLPNMYDKIYDGEKPCPLCGKSHNIVNVNDNTTIKEFSKNYYIEDHSGCAWSPDERYCILTKWSDFKSSPEKYIDQAFDKRTDPIAKKIKVFPK